MAFTKRGYFARSASLQIFMKHREAYTWNVTISFFFQFFSQFYSSCYSNVAVHLTLKVIAIPLPFASLCLSQRKKESSKKQRVQRYNMATAWHISTVRRFTDALCSL